MRKRLRIVGQFGLTLHLWQLHDGMPLRLAWLLAAAMRKKVNRVAAMQRDYDGEIPIAERIEKRWIN